MNIKLIISLTVLAFASKGEAQSCPSPNDYFADPGQCDAYTECKEGVPERQLCPEGLVFNDRLTGYPRYPCSYPQEVDCGRRTKLQPAQPTADCPHQYGMFRASSACEGSFLNCVAGVSHPHSCPEGLAFNAQTLQCDWPDAVEGCDAASFLRFSCPGLRAPEGALDNGHTRHSDPQDCRKFFVCVDGVKPRELSCGVGYVFNPELGVCDEPQNVPNCANYYPADVLKAIQALRSFDNKLI